MSAIIINRGLRRIAIFCAAICIVVLNIGCSSERINYAIQEKSVKVVLFNGDGQQAEVRLDGEIVYNGQLETEDSTGISEIIDLHPKNKTFVLSVIKVEENVSESQTFEVDLVEKIDVFLAIPQKIKMEISDPSLEIM